MTINNNIDKQQHTTTNRNSINTNIQNTQTIQKQQITKAPQTKNNNTTKQTNNVFVCYCAFDSDYYLHW